MYNYVKQKNKKNNINLPEGFGVAQFGVQIPWKSMQ